jgi:hypothetical protein
MLADEAADASALGAARLWHLGLGYLRHLEGSRQISTKQSRLVWLALPSHRH